MMNNFTIEQVREFWDNIALEYDTSHFTNRDTHVQRFEEAIKFIDKTESNARILNIWSRTGLAIMYLREKIPLCQIFNLEVSQNFINIAKAKFPNENFILTNLDRLNFEDNFFDYILSLETLEHTPSPHKLLLEFYRVLKNDGKLILSTPPATAEFFLRIYEIFFKNHGEGPHKFLSSGMVTKYLQTSGFNLIFHKGTLLMPVGPKWVKKLGEKIIDRCQNNFLKELGIRQFYVCEK